MPTYDYECLSCGKHFELFQKITDKPVDSCPQCEGKVKRLIGSGSGLIFKGNGFYATDYRKKNRSGAPENKTKTPQLPCSQCPNESCSPSEK